MILEELIEIFTKLDIPVETAEYQEKPPETYAVLTPLGDDFELFADDEPMAEVCSVRISLFTKGNYTLLLRSITDVLFAREFTVTGRRFIDRNVDTGYNNYVINVEKEYFLE